MSSITEYEWNIINVIIIYNILGVQSSDESISNNLQSENGENKSSSTEGNRNFWNGIVNKNCGWFTISFRNNCVISYIEAPFKFVSKFAKLVDSFW